MYMHTYIYINIVIHVYVGTYIHISIYVYTCIKKWVCLVLGSRSTFPSQATHLKECLSLLPSLSTHSLYSLSLYSLSLSLSVSPSLSLYALSLLSLSLSISVSPSQRRRFRISSSFLAISPGVLSRSSAICPRERTITKVI